MKGEEVEECSFEKLEVIIVGASQVWCFLIGFECRLLDSTRLEQWHNGYTRN